MAFDRRARFILWVDGGAAFVAGATVLVLHEWLARLHGFSTSLVLFLGVVNLVYASYAGALAVLASRGVRLARRAIDVLIAANASWVLVCVILVVSLWARATPFGLVHVAFEAAFVGTLALLEYRYVRPA